MNSRQRRKKEAKEHNAARLEQQAHDEDTARKLDEYDRERAKFKSMLLYAAGNPNLYKRSK